MPDNPTDHLATQRPSCFLSARVWCDLHLILLCCCWQSSSRQREFCVSFSVSIMGAHGVHFSAVHWYSVVASASPPTCSAPRCTSGIVKGPVNCQSLPVERAHASAPDPSEECNSPFIWLFIRSAEIKLALALFRLASSVLGARYDHRLSLLNASKQQKETGQR